MFIGSIRAQDGRWQIELQISLLCCYSCFRLVVVVVVFLCCCCSFVVFVVRVDVSATVIVVLVVLSFGRRRRRCCSCACCCPLSVRVVVVVVVVAFLILSKSQQMRSESLATGTDRVGVCGIPVPKEVVFADSFVYENAGGRRLTVGAAANEDLRW